MALDKLVDSTQLDTDLTSVANAIRTKGGTSAQLAFPADFVSAIGAISGGESYALLASGDYTLSADAASMTIPIGTISGTIKSFCVVRADSTRSCTYQWAGIFDVGDLTHSNFINMWMCKYSTQAQWSANLWADRPVLSQEDGTLKLTRMTSGNTVKAGTHNWYIYGEAAT